MYFKSISRVNNGSINSYVRNVNGVDCIGVSGWWKTSNRMQLRLNAEPHVGNYSIGIDIVKIRNAKCIPNTYIEVIIYDCHKPTLFKHPDYHDNTCMVDDYMPIEFMYARFKQLQYLIDFDSNYMTTKTPDNILELERERLSQKAIEFMGDDDYHMPLHAIDTLINHLQTDKSLHNLIDRKLQPFFAAAALREF